MFFFARARVVSQAFRGLPIRGDFLLKSSLCQSHGTNSIEHPVAPALAPAGHAGARRHADA